MAILKIDTRGKLKGKRTVIRRTDNVEMDFKKPVNKPL